jgi:hypothetical protein
LSGSYAQPAVNLTDNGVARPAAWTTNTLCDLALQERTAHSPDFSGCFASPLDLSFA